MRLFNWAKSEFLSIFPVFVYFLIMFNLLNMTESFLLKRAGIPPFTFWQIFVASAVIAKITLVVNHLPLLHLFRTKPLIWNALWKTFVYWFIVFSVRLFMRFYPFLLEHEGFSAELHDFVIHTNWGFFATMQSWYLFLLFLFVTSSELMHVIGAARVRQIFFGR